MSIAVRRVTKRFGDFVALDNVSVAIAGGWQSFDGGTAEGTGSYPVVGQPRLWRVSAGNAGGATKVRASAWCYSAQ